jgi:hypothetical protein
MQTLGGVGEEIRVLMHGAPLHRRPIPNAGDRALEPRAASTIRSSGRRRPRLMRWSHVTTAGRIVQGEDKTDSAQREPTAEKSRLQNTLQTRAAMDPAAASALCHGMDGQNDVECCKEAWRRNA